MGDARGKVSCGPSGTYDGRWKYDGLVATTYDADREVEEHWHLENAYIRQFADENALGTVLDMPVGTGRFSRFLSGADVVVGADISSSMLKEAQRAGPDSALVLSDGLQLPFGDGTFDHIICFRLVHLLPPEVVPLLLDEFSRVGRDRVLLQLYVHPEPKRRRVRSVVSRVIRTAVRRQRRPQPWGHITSYPHTRHDLDAMVAASGLRLDDVARLASYSGVSVEVWSLQVRDL